ncbi:MAG: hypothetical protein J7623_19100 [Chitinophaga sp.]|uniref:hypothetical protein n=1 Tax=Chitinophaga sp. TaxID=1869181 RepID=UPI001B1C76E2|nr:hypothetical protein [Chitinophaga sp.]MBO9730756.1 hypothetical protein [Chitinophaga sp.]
MKALSGKLLIATSALLLLLFTYHPTDSCPPGIYPDEARIMLFRSYLSGLDHLQPFNYTLAFTSAIDTDPLKTDNHRNCQEWQQLTGPQVALKDIYEVQYAMSPDDFLYTIKQTGSSTDNSFIKWLLQPEHRATLDYLSFAKTIEYTTAAASADPWETDGPIYSNHFLDSLATYGEQRCRSIPLPFLQERYAFQVLKILSYTIYSNNEPAPPLLFERIQSCYDQYLLHKKTIVADWGLIYYADAQKDQNSRLLLLLQAFDRSDEKKAYVDKYFTTKKLLALKPTVTDPATRRLIDAVAGLKNFGRGLKTIQEISAADPTNKYLPLLICREINKLEDWLLSPRLLGFGGTKQDFSAGPYQLKNNQKDLLYLRQVRTQLINMLKYPGTDKTLLKLAIVHLFQMDQQYGEAASYLKTIHTRQPRYLKQQAIASTIQLIYTADVTRPDIQEALYKQLSAVIRSGEESYQYETFFDTSSPYTAISQLYLLLSRQMQNKGDIVKAGLLFQKANVLVNDYYGFSDSYSNSPTDTICYNRIAFFDKYAQPADIDKLLALKHRAHKTSFEKMISPGVWSTDDFYLDLKGTIQLRQQQYQAAMATFNRIPDLFWKENYAYTEGLPLRYIGTTRALKGIDKTPYKKYPYVSKKLILQDMIQLMDTLSVTTSAAEKARLSLLLGNAYFNISRPGSAWMMFSYGKSNVEEMYQDEWWQRHRWAWYTFYPNDRTYQRPYFRCVNAIRMYQQVLTYAGNNEELAAQATVMLAVCDAATHSSSLHYHSPYEQVFFSRYNSTAAFAAAMSSCPDITTWKK